MLLNPEINDVFVVFYKMRFEIQLTSKLLGVFPFFLPQWWTVEFWRAM